MIMNKRMELGIYIAMFFVFWYYWVIESFKSLTIYPYRMAKTMRKTLREKIMSEYEKDQEALIRAERSFYGEEGQSNL